MGGQLVPRTTVNPTIGAWTRIVSASRPILRVGLCSELVTFFVRLMEAQSYKEA